MIDLELIPYEVVHPRCGGVAFYLRRLPELGAPRRSADAILLNGDPPAWGSPCRCGSCGSEFNPQREMIRERVAA